MQQNRYEPPAKAALSDDELLEALSNNGQGEQASLHAIEVLERETMLRNQDKLDFEYWVAQMQAEATESARNALARFAPQALLEVAQDETVVPEPVAEPLTTVSPPSADATDASSSAEPSVNAPFTPSAEELRQLDEILVDSAPKTSFELPVAKTSEGADARVRRATRAVIDFLASNDRAKPASQFWAWFGISGSVVPVLLAALLAQLGFSFGQSAAAMFLGFVGSAVIISVGSLAGKRSGLPTSLISRAAFGVRGNMLVAVPLIVSRVFWVVAALVAAAVLVNWFTDLPEADSSLMAVGSFAAPWAAPYVVALLIVAGVATAFGGRVLASVQKIGGLLGVLTAAGLVIAEFPRITQAQLGFYEGVSTLEMVTAAILIVAVVGLAWVSAGADFARKLPVNALGVRVVGWALLGLAVVPTVVGIASAAAFDGLHIDGDGKASQFLDVLPPWSVTLLAPGVALTLIMWISMALYSANLSFQALGLKLTAAQGAGIVAVFATLVAGFGFKIWQVGGVWQNLASLATFVGVPVAAWAGVFIADVLLRRIAYHEVSLSRSYGFYKANNWVNMLGWVLAVAVGSSMVVVKLFGLTLTGWFVVAPAGSVQANLGLLVAGLIGFAFPILFGRKRIREQEREVLATEARRRDLADIFDGNRELGFDA